VARWLCEIKVKLGENPNTEAAQGQSNTTKIPTGKDGLKPFGNRVPR
jgi:hypothetical protein